ncbi:anti-repressor SinI family protein [Thalassobacillus hwangdonensis]|uniref:Anti-repressor SinI family protein n=1 Tax=Thalassobacillus hwangdonensis TaxID=546108 RepID=A0ABW3L3B0_9BACI
MEMVNAVETKVLDEEWIMLMKEAKGLGLSIQDVERLLQTNNDGSKE